MCCNKFCVSASVLIGIAVIAVAVYYHLSKSLLHTEVEKCPYCYGKTICSAFNERRILTDISIFNVINFKNVYYGDYNNVDVVIKKLASEGELEKFDKTVCNENNATSECDLKSIQDVQNYTQKILENMGDDDALFKPFKVCSSDAVEVLYDYFYRMKPDDVEDAAYLKNVWTILKINVEPLILQLLKADDHWPLPKIYGSCGRFTVVENRGEMLMQKGDLPWIERAYLALQLLEGAKNFTFNHPHFRFYLTDISPDNIAVDDALKVTFVDLENLVVFHKKTSTNGDYHRSEVIHDPSGFAYSQDDLCSHTISDHNYYAVCKLLLSRSAPYPMMKNGLLHTPPLPITYNYQHLFDLIEECSDGSTKSDRFESGKEILDILDHIISEDKYNKTVTDK